MNKSRAKEEQTKRKRNEQKNRKRKANEKQMKSKRRAKEMNKQLAKNRVANNPIYASFSQFLKQKCTGESKRKREN